MKKHILLICTVALMASCSPSKEDLLEKINAMEQAENKATPEGLAELAEMHKNYGLKYKDAQANNYLYAAAQFYYYENDTINAEKLLSEYISRDDSTERYRNAILNLAIVHSKKQEHQKADELISEMLDQSPPTPAQWQDIRKMYEVKIAGGKEVKEKDYEQLALANTAVGRFPAAIQNLEIAAETFKDSENRPNIIYRAGFIAWEYLQDTERAKGFYTQFLAEYPNDKRTDEVKEILNAGMLEMTDEQILEMLKAKTSK